MKRERKMIVVCHCLLNCNSKVEDLSLFNGVHGKVKEAINDGFGIIQLPCPELAMYGMKRWGHVKNQFDNDFFRNECRKMLTPFMHQFKEYLANDYTIKHILAVDFSPSCGYNKTCVSSSWCGNLNELPKPPKVVEERGVFIEVLEQLLKENNLHIKIIGIDEREYEESQSQYIEV